MFLSGWFSRDIFYYILFLQPSSAPWLLFVFLHGPFLVEIMRGRWCWQRPQGSNWPFHRRRVDLVFCLVHHGSSANGRIVGWGCRDRRFTRGISRCAIAARWCWTDWNHRARENVGGQPTRSWSTNNATYPRDRKIEFLRYNYSSNTATAVEDDSRGSYI